VAHRRWALERAKGGSEPCRMPCHISNSAAQTQPEHTTSLPVEEAQEGTVPGVIPDPEAVRNGVLWAQDRARQRAVEEWELERYMSWAER